MIYERHVIEIYNVNILLIVVLISTSDLINYVDYLTQTCLMSKVTVERHMLIKIQSTKDPTIIL